MATQVTQTETAATTNGAPREVISYDPATGLEVGRAPLSSAEDVSRGVARETAGAYFLAAAHPPGRYDNALLVPQSDEQRFHS